MIDPQDIRPSKWAPLVTIVTTAGIGGAIIGALRTIIQRRYGGWLMWLSLMSCSVLTAVLVSLAIHDTGLSPSLQAAIIGVSAFLAEDILLGLGALGSLFSKDPIGAVRKIWDAVRGKGAEDKGAEK